MIHLGVDNARDQSHREATENALKKSSKDLVLFIMDGDHMHGDAENAFLDTISESMSVGGKQSRERFLFVISKLDDYDSSKDNIAQKTIPDVLQYLKDKGIENPYIFPTGALPALKIRQYQQGLDDKSTKRAATRACEDLIDDPQKHLEQYICTKPDFEDDEFNNTVLSDLKEQKYLRISRVCENTILNELKQAKNNNDEFAEALIHSGIRGLEETIKIYVDKYTRPTKITNIVRSFEKQLEQSNAMTSTVSNIASLGDDLEDKNKQIKILRAKINDFKNQDNFRNKIKNLNFKGNLNDELNEYIIDFESAIRGFFDKHPERIEPERIERILYNFVKLADQQTQKFKTKVDELLSDDIEAKADKLLKEYTDKLRSISDEVRIGNFEIDLVALVAGKLGNVQYGDDFEDDLDLIENAMEVEVETKTKIVTKREERSRTNRKSGLDRLFSPKHWFKPSYTEYYQVDVDYEEEYDVEHKYINVSKISEQKITPIRKMLQESKHSILEGADLSAKKLKEYFLEQFDIVDEILSNKIGELENATASKEEMQKALDKSKKDKALLDDVFAQLNKILEI